MSPSRPFQPRLTRRLALAGASALLVSGLGACSTVDSVVAESSAVAVVAEPGSVWDSSVVHDIGVELDPDDFTAMVETYRETGEKEWIAADVTIDGTTFRDVGMRLKGNSSLRSVSADAAPADLPWLIDLDQFVDGQELDGSEAFVIRSNTSETALNEAVALELLGETGLTTESAVSSRFSVNGEDAQLRLVVEDLDQKWYDARLGTDGTLYKSEAGGDWSYRGDDAASYEDVFDIEAGTDDHAPLTDFLQWLEESSDAEFADGLADRLDVQAFADYLAFEDLVGNFDDIEGPGNNSFLHWDAEAGRMTVVAWDHNLAFGVMNSGGPGGGTGPGGGMGPGAGERPERLEPPGDRELPEGFEPPGDRMGGGPGDRGGNVLAERFQETAEFAAMYDESVERLTSTLYTSGTAQDVLDRWTTVLEEQASDLVDVDTIRAEAEQVASYFDGHAVDGA